MSRGPEWIFRVSYPTPLGERVASAISYLVFRPIPSTFSRPSIKPVFTPFFLEAFLFIYFHTLTCPDEANEALYSFLHFLLLLLISTVLVFYSLNNFSDCSLRVATSQVLFCKTYQRLLVQIRYFSSTLEKRNHRSPTEFASVWVSAAAEHLVSEELARTFRRAPLGSRRTLFFTLSPNAPVGAALPRFFFSLCFLLFFLLAFYSTQVDNARVAERWSTCR